jgi:tetratricopeptide (TPR) repeat protein
MPELPSERRPGLPSAVDAVLMKALAKDADSRHVTVLNFNEAVEKAFEGFKGLPEKPAEPAAAVAAAPDVSEAEEKKKPKMTASYEVQKPEAAAEPRDTAKAWPAGVEEKKKPRTTAAYEAQEQKAAAPAEDIPPGETLQGAVPGPAKIADKKPDEPEKAAITKEYPKSSVPATAPLPSGEKPEKAEAEEAKPEKAEAKEAKPEKAETEEAKPEKAAEKGEAEKAKPEKAEAEKAEPKKAEPGEKEPKAEKDTKVGKKKPAEKEAEAKDDKEKPSDGKIVRDPTVSQMWYAEGEEAQKALKEMVAKDRASEDTAPALPAMYEKMDHGPSGGHKVVMVLAGGLAVLLVVALIVVGMRKKKGDAPDDEEVATSKGRPDAAEVKTSPGPDAAAPKAAADAEPPKKAGPDAAPARTRPLVLDPDGLIIKGPGTPGGRKPGARRPRDGRTGPGRLPRDPRDPTIPTGPSPKQLAKEEVKLGRAALRRGALGQAASHFKKARKLYPGSGSALAGLGEVAFERAKYGTAAKHLRSALRYSASLKVMVMLGNSYFKLGRYKSAERMFLKVLKRRPSHAEAKRNLQVVRRRLGRTMAP